MGERLSVDYRALFKVEIRHNFFLNRGPQAFEYLSPEQQQDVLAAYDLRDTLRIVPAYETRLELKRYRLLLRQNTSGFTVYAPVTDDRLDFPFEASKLFRFHAVAGSESFDHISNINLDGGERCISLFGTGAANVDPEGLHLSHPLAGFSSDRDYLNGSQVVDAVSDPTQRYTAVVNVTKGSIRKSGEWIHTSPLPPRLTQAVSNATAQGDRARKDGVIYEALVGSPGTNVTDPTRWKRLFSPGIQAANEADQRGLSSRIFSIDLSPASPNFVAAEVSDRNGRSVNRVQMQGEDGSPLREVHLDLGKHAVGAFRVRLRNVQGRLLKHAGRLLPQADQELYVDDEAIRLSAFAVFEIHSDSPGYELIDNVGKLKSPTYLLRIPSRPTFWGYVFPKPLTPAEQGQVGSEFVTVTGRSDRIIAREARALNRGFIRLKRLSTDKLLPNPSEQTGISVDGDSGRLISNIYLTHRA